jgi:hypothetical protein
MAVIAVRATAVALPSTRQFSEDILETLVQVCVDWAMVIRAAILVASAAEMQIVTKLLSADARVVYVPLSGSRSWGLDIESVTSLVHRDELGT